MSPQVQGTPQDEQDIRKAATEFVTAWNRNDAKGLAACFASDGDLINPAGQIARGRAGVEKLLAEEQNRTFKGTRISVPQKHLSFLKPDIAIVDYEFEIAHLRGADGKETALKGLLTNVLRKEGDRWLIAAARPMVPSPLPATSNR